MEHINQKVVGYIKLGDAGLTKDDIEKGYICHICTMDNDNRFVDLAVTKAQMRDLSSMIANALSSIGGD